MARFTGNTGKHYTILVLSSPTLLGKHYPLMQLKMQDYVRVTPQVMACLFAKM